MPTDADADVTRSGVPLPPDRLADQLAVTRLQHAYADVITRRAFGELAELFLPDVAVHLDLVTVPPRTLVGPEQFVGFVEPAMARFDHFNFVVLSAVAELVADDVARGRLFMCEVRHDPEQGWTRAYGRYLDEFRRVDGRWWFAERRYRSMARTGASEAVLPLPAPGPGSP